MQRATEALVKTQIDFVPIAILTSDINTGWIGSYHMKLSELMPFVFRNADRFIAEKNHNSTNIETCMSKTCKTHVLLRNLDILDKINEKR